jgi:hypothetical protein
MFVASSEGIGMTKRINQKRLITISNNAINQTGKGKIKKNVKNDGPNPNLL